MISQEIVEFILVVMVLICFIYGFQKISNNDKRP